MDFTWLTWDLNLILTWLSWLEAWKKNNPDLDGLQFGLGPVFSEIYHDLKHNKTCNFSQTCLNWCETWLETHQVSDLTWILLDWLKTWLHLHSFVLKLNKTWLGLVSTDLRLGYTHTWLQVDLTNLKSNKYVKPDWTFLPLDLTKLSWLELVSIDLIWSCIWTCLIWFAPWPVSNLTWTCLDWPNTWQEWNLSWICLCWIGLSPKILESSSENNQCNIWRGRIADIYKKGLLPTESPLNVFSVQFLRTNM